MKNSKLCPKCRNSDILRIPGQSGSYGSGNNIPVGLTIFSSVKVTRFVCVSCGFTEEWIEEEHDREKLRKKHEPL